MAITNGYCTLDELKARLLDTQTYSASTLSFTAASKTIADSAAGLKRFLTERRVRVSGSATNDGVYTVVTGDTPEQLVVAEALVDEPSGSAITVTDVTHVENDESLERAIEEVSRFIDDWCGTRFSITAETRYYTATQADRLAVDDLVSLSSLVTDIDGDRTYEHIWASTDYDLVPYNAGLDLKPYTAIQVTPEGGYSFPVGIPKGVKVAGTFGYWSSIPPQVHAACLIMAARLFKRKDAPFGVTGAPAVEQLIAIARVDPDFEILLRAIRDNHRAWVG